MIKIACASLSCDGFDDVNFKEAFSMLPQIGYKYVEFDCWSLFDLTPAKIRDIKERCASGGLIPAAVYSNGFGGRDKSELAKDIAHKLRMIDAAKELGCSRIVATGSKRGESGGLEAIIMVLKAVAPYAQEQGVMICLENHAGNNIENTEDYRKIFEAVTSPNVGMCMDTGHFIMCSVDMDELVDLFGKRIVHVHVKEKREKTSEVVSFTEYNHKILKRLIKEGYEGFITVEIPPVVNDSAVICSELTVARQAYERYESD